MRLVEADCVADLTDGGLAVGFDQSHLAARQPKRGEPALLGHELHAGAGRASELGPGPRTELDRVDDGADRDGPQRERVAGTDVRAPSRLQSVTDRKPLRRKDIALLAVRVVQQRDPGRPVGVVLDVRDLGRDAVLVPPEIDDTVPSLVAAALVADRDPALGPPAGALPALGDERFFRASPSDLVEAGDARAAASRRRRLVFADGHPGSSSSLTIS